MKKLLKILNTLDNKKIKYNFINEIDQIRIELYKNKKYIHIDIIFDEEKNCIIHYSDTYNLEDLEEVLKL